MATSISPTTSDVGNTLLNSLSNTGFDAGNMAKVLAEAEVSSQRLIVDRNKTKSTTELDALTYLRSNLTAFNSYVTDISDANLYSAKTASSSNESLVTVSASNSAVAGSYNIEARQLAQTHTQITNKTYNSPYDTFSTGTLTIAMGGVSKDITIDSSNNSLSSLQKYINSGDYGVTASVVNNGGSYQLMFTSKQQGAAGEMSISSSNVDAFTPGLTTTAEAQDALMVLNGLEVSSASNTFDQVIEGVSFNLNSVSVGQNTQVTIGLDPQSVVDKVKSFVDVYNQLDTIFKDLGSYDTDNLTEEQLASDEYKYTGDLAGNSVLREVRSQIKSSLSGAISEIAGSYNSLAVVGLKFNLDGTMALDESRLSELATNNMEALSQLFVKGGSSSDSLITVTGGSDQTKAGSYSVDITQAATRASILQGNATISTDQQVSGGRIVDSVGALTLAGNASLDLTIDGVSNSVDLSTLAATYSSKTELATAIQSQIESTYGAAANSLVSVTYNTTQAKFQIAANSGIGAVTINSATNLQNQGFAASTVYSGQGLIDLTGGDSTFDIKVDDSNTATISIASGRYTLEDLAVQMTSNINNNADIKDSGNSVSVTTQGSALNIVSNRFGAFSSLDISNITGNLATNSGLSSTAATVYGQSVDGTLTTANGTINLGAYADLKDGRLIKISDYQTTLTEVRGLQLEVLGVTTATASVSFAQGFASRVEETINGFFDSDTGVIQRREDLLNTKMTEYDEKNTALDERYNKVLEKYKLQFAMLQSIMSNAAATRSQLTAQFSNNN